MNPPQLLIQPVPATGRVHCRWFGETPGRPAGALTLPRDPDAQDAALPDRFALDLAPLVAEVRAGLIGNAADLAAAPDLLPLCELLDADGPAALCGALYPWLRQLARAPGAPLLHRAPGARAWADPHWRLVPLWYAAAPVLQATAPADSASDPNGSACGRARVLVPRSHRPAPTAAPWWRRLIRLEPDRRPRVRTRCPVPAPRFRHGLAARLATGWPPGRRDALVIVPDAGLGFEDALMRAAQLGYDLKHPGELLVFTPAPAGGGDQEPVAAAADPGGGADRLAGFLGDLGDHSGAAHLDLLVQGGSVGTLLDALERLAARGGPLPHLGQVVLCAPHCDPAARLERLPRVWERCTLLVPAAPPVAPGQPDERRGDLDTIVVTGYPLSELGDEYHAIAEPLIRDLRALFTDRHPAAERFLPRAPGGHFVIAVR